MKKNLICVSCPLGCPIEVEIENGEILSVTGNTCKRGDKYARDENVYMLDQTKIGELVRRDFTWITSGEVNSVLQRRPGTELYEGIMNKYADMYIDAWRCHGIITNCKVVAPNTPVTYYPKQVEVVNTVNTTPSV